MGKWQFLLKSCHLESRLGLRRPGARAEHWFLHGVLRTWPLLPPSFADVVFAV